MNCDFIRENEIAEKHILGRLPETVRNAYLKHLEQCESCQNDWKAEQTMIGGIKEAGRREMKAEIGRQANALKFHHKTIGRFTLLRAAAVLLFLVLAPGVIYYHQNIMQQEHQAGKLRQQQPAQKPAEVEPAIPLKNGLADSRQRNDKQSPGTGARRAAPEEAAKTEAAEEAEKSPPWQPLKKSSPATPQRSSQENRDVDMPEVGEAASPAPKQPMPVGPQHVPTKSATVKEATESASDQLTKGETTVTEGTVYQPMTARGHKNPRTASQEMEPGSQPILPPAKLRLRSQQFSQRNLPAARDRFSKPEKEAYSEPEKSTLTSGEEQTPDLVRHLAGKTIHIFLEKPYQSMVVLEKEGLPEWFTIEIFSLDSTKLKMVWYAEPYLAEADTSKIRLELAGDDRMKIIVGEAGTYEVSLKRLGRTRGVLQ